MENAVVSKDREKTKNNKKPYRRFWGLLISSIIIFSILTAGIIWLEGLKASQDQDYARINNLYVILNKKVDNIEKTKHTRIKFFKNKFLSDSGKKYAYSVSNFLRQLGVWSKKELKFTEIEIIPLTQNFSFVLKGYLNTNQNRYAQTPFQKFYQQISNYDTMVHINLSKIRINNVERGQGMVIFFAINGEIEAE